MTSGAHFGEIFRGAFKAVHPGEIEAAVACGMGCALRFRRIAAPLTLRHALPGRGNGWQVVLKESAVVSITEGIFPCQVDSRAVAALIPSEKVTTRTSGCLGMTCTSYHPSSNHQS